MKNKIPRQKLYDIKGIVERLIYLEYLFGEIPKRIKRDMVEIVRDESKKVIGFRLRYEPPDVIFHYDEKGNLKGWKTI